MKKCVVIAVLLISTAAFAQSAKDSVLFASGYLPVPEGCNVKGANEVHCDNYSIAWRFGDKKTVEGLQDAFLEVGSFMSQSKKKKHNLYLVDTKTKGYKVSYKSGTGTAYQLSTTGAIDGKPVWVLLTLKNDLVTNNDIPEFARQIIRLAP